MAVINISDDLARRLRLEAERLQMSDEERLSEILDSAIAPEENFAPEAMKEGLGKLCTYLQKIPALQVMAASDPTEPYWWVKFIIDINDPLAWNVVQELGYVFNYLSLEEPLPTLFMPVSPPPYLNGGPEYFLAWVIEAKAPFLDAGLITTILEDRLPNPVEEIDQWLERTSDDD